MRKGLRAWRTAAIVLLLARLGVADAEPGDTRRLEATMLDGSAYSLADSRGRPVVLMFWSPASLASRKSLPELQRFHAEFTPRGIVIRALATTGDLKEIRRVAAARGVDAPLGVLGANDLGPLPEARLPAIRVFDRDGRLVASHDGIFRLRDLQRDVDALLAR